MKISNIRRAAANELVTSIDATPATVQAAYERRLKQYMDFSNTDINTARCLYDARVIMLHSPQQELIARAKLALTGDAYKIYQTALAQIRLWRNNSDHILVQVFLDINARILRQIYNRYRVFRALCAYELAGLGGTAIYNNVSDDPNPIVPMVTYGSMLIAGIGMGCAMNSINKKWQEYKMFNNFFCSDKQSKTK